MNNLYDYEVAFIKMLLEQKKEELRKLIYESDVSTNYGAQNYYMYLNSIRNTYDVVQNILRKL